MCSTSVLPTTKRLSEGHEGHESYEGDEGDEVIALQSDFNAGSARVL